MNHLLTSEQLNQIKFINLNSHTHFSIPFGVGTPKAHLKKAIKAGHAGFCITDINSMAGCLPLIKAVKESKTNTPLVLGAELNIIDDLNVKDKTNRYFNITCYVKNFLGYKNLSKLISESGKDDHFYYKPRISLAELIEYKEGLIITSGNHYGMIGQSILKETGQEELLIKIFQEYFNDDFYIQINYHNRNNEFDYTAKKYVDTGFDPQKMINLRLMELIDQYNLKYFITQNSFMPDKKNKIQQDILLGNDKQYKRVEFFEHHTFDLKSVEEMYSEVIQMSPYISDDFFIKGCETTIEILNKCKDLKLKFKPELPSINYHENYINKSAVYEENFNLCKDLIKEKCQSLYDLFVIADKDLGLKTTLKIIINNKKIDFSKKDYTERLAFELKVIQRNGVIKLLDYFLLLEDVTHFVRENGFLRGFGRGSGAGSLLAYVLDITDCDPLVYDLLFERFLTQERIGKFLVDHSDFPIESLISMDEALHDLMT